MRREVVVRQTWKLAEQRRHEATDLFIAVVPPGDFCHNACLGLLTEGT
jgi:hypothetical protein